MSDTKKKSGFKVWTEKHAQLWQIIKFTLVSMIAGASEMLTYNLFILWILKPLTSMVTIPSIHYSATLCVMISYLVSATIGNLTSFVVNRKTTFKSVQNIKFSITATFIMIAFIIFYSTVLGYPVNQMVASWFKGMQAGGLKDFLTANIGKLLISMFTFVFVFFMNKFVILREEKKTKEQKEAEKKAALEAMSKPTKKVVNEKLVKVFGIATICLFVLSAILIIPGSITKNAVLLISGAIAFGFGYVSCVETIIEKVGEKVPIEELGEYEGKEGYVIKDLKN